MFGCEVMTRLNQIPVRKSDAQKFGKHSGGILAGDVHNMQIYFTNHPIRKELNRVELACHHQKPLKENWLLCFSPLELKFH
jgi:hypothetical protein